MTSRIDHAALNTADFDWHVSFFQNIFGMTVQRTAGAPPARKLWFHEGIQINETAAPAVPGSACDHICLAVEDVPGTVERAVEAGCSRLSEGAHWFALPGGMRIELIRFSN